VTVQALFPAVDLTYTGDERLGSHLLQHDRLNPNLDGIQDLSIIRCCSKEDHASRQLLASHTPEKREGTVSRKVDVEDQDVWLMETHGAQRAVAVGARCHNRTVTFPCEDLRQPAQREGMVTSQDQADRAG
jgi:hypothetical protein